MIYVNRSRVDPPKALLEEGIAERKHAQSYFETSFTRQIRFEFKAYRSPDVRDALLELFHSKCAYCESKIGSTGPIDVEMFRPKSAVAERKEHPGYWWLAGVWENLLSSCIDCNRTRRIEGVLSGKANRFPLEDEDCRAFFPGEEAKERPLLLDPCIDSPEQHLVFDEQGLVMSGTLRGQTTISLLGLNRKGLVERRLQVANTIKSQLQILRSMKEHIEAGYSASMMFAQYLNQLKQMTDASQEFAGMKRQLILPYLSGFENTVVSELVSKWDAVTPIISRASRNNVKKSYYAFTHLQSDFSLATEKGRNIFLSQRRQVERVSIRNFKGIKSLDIDLTNNGGGLSTWLMLLGENGVGKSSVLQAIAMTLLGADYLSKLVSAGRANPSEFVRARSRKAQVEIVLSGFVGPHRLILERERVTYITPTGESEVLDYKEGRLIRATSSVDYQSMQAVLLGYGSTRLLPRNNKIKYGALYSRVDNLFDSFVPLVDADAWLKSLPLKSFNEVALVLKDLLALDDNARLIRYRGSVLMELHGRKVPIKHLSDGYQSVIAMSIDILEVLMRLWPGLQSAEGIVLLDEIGAHLHPTWRMRIVGSLRRALPGVQFIATTHEPLCLRGLRENEIVVMRRDVTGEVQVISELPSPSDFRIDQLLTSTFFGLSSTQDPETEELFDEYYCLLAKDTHDEVETARLAELHVILDGRRLIGDTLREQLMFEAIDKLVAHQREQPQSIPKLKQAAIDEIARIWNEETPELKEDE